MKYLLSGFFVKILAGFDDTVTRIPIFAHVAKTKMGKIAFIIGIFIAVSLAIVISFFFGSVIKSIPYSNYISAGLVLLIALSIYFDLFVQRPKEKIEVRLKHIKGGISKRRFLKVFGIGFITAFATIIDDIFVYSGLFLGPIKTIPFVIGGILLATVLQLSAVVYFSTKLIELKYKKEITVAGLIVLAALLAFRVL
jgi:hypothetical protein